MVRLLSNMHIARVERLGMKNFHIFLGLLTAALVGLVLSLFLLALYYPLQPVHGMGGMMGGMMQGMMRPFGPSDSMYPQPPLVMQALPWAFGGLLVAAVVGVIYFALMPEIRRGWEPTQTRPQEPQLSLETVLKTLKPDERQVVLMLRKHGGVSLQKDIRWELGLTRLKTHRIISRLAERGVVHVKPSGNTNEVALADWLSQSSKEAPINAVEKK